MLILEIKSLTKSFNGLTAVKNLSFEIPKGSITALIGPNGSGKTTVLNMITGLYRPNSGNILLKGEKIINLPPHKIALKGIVRTFQNIRLFSNLTVLDNILLANRLTAGENLLSVLFQKQTVKNEHHENAEKALSYLELVDLVDKKQELAGHLSHGQRKLLELARVLATESEMLLLDEPTAGVFQEMKTKVMDIICNLRDKGKSILFIEHDMTVTMGLADKVIVLDCGQKIAEEVPDEIIKNERVIEAYLGRRKIAS